MKQDDSEEEDISAPRAANQDESGNFNPEVFQDNLTIVGD
jgi:hypothetical protein